MRRRTALKLLGSSAIALPWRAKAQTTHTAYHIGILTAVGPLTDSSPNGSALIAGLARHGYIQGRNLLFERRGANGQLRQLPRLVDELVASKVDVILAFGFPPAFAAKSGANLPVVVTGAGDPVATRLADSLARPGGHLTGVSDVVQELTTKRMELLRELAPGLRRVAMLWNTDDLAMTLRYRASEVAANSMGITIQALGVREPDDFEQAFAAMKLERPDAILMVSDSLVNLNRRRIFDLATAQRLPAIYENEMFVLDGGLMSYAADPSEVFGRVASLIDRILRGSKPAELPIEQPTRYRFVINLKSAKAISIDVPPSLLARADEVIE